MRTGPQYHRVNADEDAVDNLELGTIQNPLLHSNGAPASSNESPYIAVKVLLKEQTFEITGLSPNDSVGRLKEFIASATEVPANRQRLIFSGRSLTPEDKPLSHFKIANNSSVHLFPLPAAVSVSSTTVNSSTATAQNVRPLSNDLSNLPPFEPVDMRRTSSILQFDSSIEQNGREVRKLGSSNLDSVVFVLDTIVSGLGSWVGILGLKSVHTLHLPDVRKYVRWLGIVAVCSMVMRVLWVFDVVYSVQKAVKQSEEQQSDHNNNVPDGATGGETGDGDVSGEVIDHKAIFAFGIQATIIALICLFAWSSCFRRAVSFYRAVAWREISSNRPPLSAVNNLSSNHNNNNNNNGDGNNVAASSAVSPPALHPVVSTV